MYEENWFFGQLHKKNFLQKNTSFIERNSYISLQKIGFSQSLAKNNFLQKP